MTAPASVWAVSVDEEDGGWVVSADGVVVETARGHYDAWSVLALAERYAGRSLVWRLDPAGGFVSA